MTDHLAAAVLACNALAAGYWIDLRGVLIGMALVGVPWVYVAVWSRADRMHDDADPR